MGKTFEQGREEISSLCRYYATNRHAFLAAGVKEAQVRQALIDPLFEALGWDVHNTQRLPPQYLEVVYHPSLDDEGERKEPDYAFRVGPAPRFYAEAKKCTVGIATDPLPAYQLRRYGWSAKVALSLLTNFEELGVYDCTRRPRPAGKPSDARIQHLHCDEYPDRWRELWEVFSREVVWSGAFDQYAASKRKRGTSEVDTEFLKEVEGWRETLARNMALRNPDLSSDDLNAAVQITIDRVVFLRMAEDRGFEPYQQLLKLCERPDVYARFTCELCRRADQKYNAGLFHFQKEEDVAEAPDRITPNLIVDDRVFKPILHGLYFEHGSPYHFAVLPVEILGTVYERFLGKVVRLTAGHQAKVEEKPEVRKAGGVYYTPSYIVEYIVRQTIGRQVHGRSPMQLAGLRNGKQPFRVLDMACGSGSFLLGAYQCLLDHCLKWYTEHEPGSRRKAVCKELRNGGWRLTIEEKKRILTSHIFGVDIDPQAVEVSKLSLLLKVLEGENEQTLHRQLRLFHERALPNLAENIRCGNSLIGPDYFAGELVPETDELRQVNAFDWDEGFPDAMKAGGFDCIIGNPPYYKISGRTDPDRMAYFGKNFECAGFKTELYALFAERSFSLLRNGGLHSFIVPNSFLAGVFLRPLRLLLAERNTLIEIVFLKDVKVFQAAKLDSVMYVAGRLPPTEHTRMVLRVADAALSSRREQVQELAVSEWRKLDEREFRVIAGRLPASVLSRLRKCKCRLRDVASVHLGLVLESNAMLRKQPSKTKPNPILLGRDFGRYIAPTAGNWFSFLSDRIVGGTKNPWVYASGPRILIQAIRNLKLRRRLIGTLVAGGTYTMGTIHNVILRHSYCKPEFLLGLLNSNLLNEFYTANYPEHRIKGAFLEALPLPDLNLQDARDRSRHDRMVKLVEATLSLHKQLAGAKSEGQRTAVQRQIAATDKQIDRLVYELYGLTAKQVSLVESAIEDP
jgi:hypothetical protein